MRAGRDHRSRARIEEVSALDVHREFDLRVESRRDEGGDPGGELGALVLGEERLVPGLRIGRGPDRVRLDPGRVDVEDEVALGSQRLDDRRPHAQPRQRRIGDGSALEVIPTIRSLYPDLEIMIFSGRPAGIYKRALLRYRIGYIVSKQTPETETLAVLGRFLNDEFDISDDILRPAPRKKNPLVPFANMPAREIDVLHYLLRGWRTNQIAETLNLSVSTISTLKSRIFERTQTSNIRELMDLATIHQVN